MTGNPRLFGAWSGIDTEFVTFKYDTSVVYSATVANGSAQVGLAVTLVSDGTVGLTTDAVSVLGQLESVESDGYCRVLVRGFCRLPAGNGATVTAGSKVVGALGAASAHGYVRNPAASAAEAIVADSMIIDASDSTAVVVDVGR